MGKSEFVINGHIQQVPENAADVGHLNAIHSPNMFTGSDIRYTRPRWGSFATHTWDLKYKIELINIFSFYFFFLFLPRYEPSQEEDRKHIADMTLRHSLKVFNLFELMTMDITVQQVIKVNTFLRIVFNLGLFYRLVLHTFNYY